MAEKTNSYQDYQDAQSQLLNIQAQQQANLQEARLMGQSQMATNNALNQAAQVAAQTVAMGNTTQPVTFNPTTQAVLQQYGLGQPRVVRNQSRSQSTTPQHVTINNNTSNITNNNVSVPANIGGPLQGRPVQINPDIQMGTFKTWLSNVFAQQNAEAARRDREYEKRESALNRNSNKILKKIGEIGGNIGKALDPRRATSNNVNTIKTLFKVLGIAKLAQNWDVIAEKLDGLVNFFKKDKEGDDNKGFLDKLQDRVIKLIGGKENETIGAAIKRFFWNNDVEDSESGENLGVLQLFTRRIKRWLEERVKAVEVVLGESDLKPNTKNPVGNGILKAGDKIIKTLGAIIKALISGDATGIISQMEENTADANTKQAGSANNYDTFSVARYNNGGLSTNNQKELTAETNIVYDSETKRPISSQKIKVDRGDVDFSSKAYGVANLNVTEKSNYDFYDNRYLTTDGKLMNDPMASITLSQHLTVLLNMARSGMRGVGGKRFDVSNIMEIITGLKRLLELARNAGKIPVCYEFIFTFGNIQGEKGNKVSINGDPIKICPYKVTIVPKKEESTGLVFTDFSGNISHEGVMHYEEKLVRALDAYDTGTLQEKNVYYYPEVSEKNLLDIINTFTNRKEGEKFFTLDEVESHKAIFNVVSSQTSKKDKKFKEEEQEQQNKFVKFEEVEKLKKENAEKNAYEAVNSRPAKGVNYALNETVAGQAAISTYGKTRLLYNKAEKFVKDIFGNNKQKKEFIKSIESLRPILQDILGEDEHFEEKYNMIRALLADETNFGDVEKDFKDNNNLTGILSDLKLSDDGTKTIPEDETQPTFTKSTKYTFDDNNLDNHKRFIGRVDGYPDKNPKVNARNKWEWKVNEEYNKYNTIDDFLKDYLNRLIENYQIFDESSYGSNATEKMAAKLRYPNKNSSGEDIPAYFNNSVNDFVKDINKRIEEINKLGEDVGEGKGDSSEYNLPTYKPFYRDYNNEEDPIVKHMKTYSSVVSNYPEFDVDRAIDTLLENTSWEISRDGKKLRYRENRDKGYNMCARHVTAAIRSGGINLPGGDAKDYLTDSDKNGQNILEDYGFKKIQPGNFQKGDVYVQDNIPGHKYGHMSMYDGTKWISDFIQTRPDGSAYDVEPGKKHYFRYNGRTIANGTIIHDNSTSTTSEINYKKEFEDDFISKLSGAFRDFAAKSREANETKQSGAGDGEGSTENYEKILYLLNQISNSQNSIAYYTAATADEVRTNTQVTAQQMNRPVEKRTSTNSYMSNEMNSNYGE